MFVYRRVLIPLIILFLMVLVASCVKEKRHKALTFFFDGVPPLEEPNTGALSIAGDPNSFDGDQEAEPEEVVIVSRAHGKGRKCNLCHKKQTKGRWSTPKILKDIPEMCFDCHGSYAQPKRYVHGPVAVGQCDFCHDPHGSREEASLHDAIPVICYRCHDQSSIESLPSHDKETVSECTLCHEAHSSSKRKLLKLDNNTDEKTN